MNKNALQKCRTCLKASEKTFSLTEPVVGCIPEQTYSALLKEYAKLECIADYEHVMPQYICILCCRKLKDIYAFIKQAQYCNDKLLNVISKKLECLREKRIDLPEIENESEKSVGFDAKPAITTNLSTTDQGEKNLETDESRNENIINLISGPEANEVEKNIEEKHFLKQEGINNCVDLEVNYPSERNESIDLLVEQKETDANNYCLEINPEESQIVTVCPICEKNISTPDELKLHMRTQHDIKRPTKINQQQRLQIKESFDLKEKLEARKIFACKMCPSRYTNRHSYLHHLIRKHNIDERKRKEKQINEKLEDIVLKCRSCDYTARTYAALNYHRRSKHGTESDKFKCTFCNNSYLKKFDLMKHVKNIHKELIKTLKAKAVNNGELRKDLSDVVQPEPIEDPTDDEFSTDDDVPLVKRTVKTKMKEDDERFSDEDFIRNILNIKKRKIKSSTTSLARKCDICGNIYRNHRALYAHKKTVHISEDKYSLCPHCGKKYKRKTDLRIHIERDHIPKNSEISISKQPAKVREKRFMCTECSYVCTTITILNIHINRKHTGEKPYKCDICLKSFLVPYDLKIHRYLHTGERPYKCPICSKGFRDNSHMMKHKRIHSSERPYKCKECGKGFTLAYYLHIHNRTHLREKKLDCATCGKVFENRSLLNFHRMSENHQDEVA